MNKRFMSEHPGQELKLLRESKGITLEQASQETCIRVGMLRALEESSDADLLPSVYRKLSLRMYARYLGVNCEITRTAEPPSRTKAKHITPVGAYLRRMKESLNTPTDPVVRRNRLFTFIKTASAAVVIVVAAGLWSLNAKISRLHLDDTAPEPAAVLIPSQPTKMPPRSNTTPVKANPSLNLNEPISLTFDIPIHWIGWVAAE